MKIYQSSSTTQKLIRADQRARFYVWEKLGIPEFALKHVIPKWRLEELEAMDDAKHATKCG